MDKNSSPIPSHFSPKFSRSQIQAAVDRLGAEITEWALEVWRSSHSDVVAIPILRGGLFFFADLVRAIETSVYIAPAQTWGYVPAANAVQSDQVRVNIENVPAKGRSILLVDDICDSGKTLEALKAALLEKGATSVKSAVLIRRVLEKQHATPDWVGFEYHGDEWFVGYGMEDSDRWRNLPDVHIIQHGS